MVISSFISSVLLLVIGVWAYFRLEASMGMFAERQLVIEPSKFSYKMWKDMPVSMYQSFTFFNLTNWQQVKSHGQKPRFVEVGPYVYKTTWIKSDLQWQDSERQVSFVERKRWHFDARLSRGAPDDDFIWTINTPLMTALALIQNAPVITRNIVSVILDGLGEGAFIKRNVKSLLFDGYSDLIVSVGPLFDRRFANFNGKFAYLYNKNDTLDGHYTVATGVDELHNLNKILKYHSAIYNVSSNIGNGSPAAQGLNEVRPECAYAWTLNKATNGQLFAPHLSSDISSSASPTTASVTQQQQQQQQNHHHHNHHHHHQQQQQHNKPRFFARATGVAAPPPLPPPILASDLAKFIFYPDLCRPLHLVNSGSNVSLPSGIQAIRYLVDPQMFMNSSQLATNKCFEMNPRAPLANTIAATLNQATTNLAAVPQMISSGSSPFAVFSQVPQQISASLSATTSTSSQPSSPSTSFHSSDERSAGATVASPPSASSLLGPVAASLERSQSRASTFLSNVGLHAPGSPAANAITRLGNVRQLLTNMVTQRMSGMPASNTLTSGLGSLMAPGTLAHHFGAHLRERVSARNAPDDAADAASSPVGAAVSTNHPHTSTGSANTHTHSNQHQPSSSSHSDRWITQFRFKWPRGVFSIGQCQLGAPIYASLPHFLDADEYFLDQVDGLKPNRSLHEFYIDVESTLNSIPVGAKARMQLNVATPDLKFRNIPNAMIPVLWQEVTFDIDKPIQQMLFWTMTMSGCIYSGIAYTLIAIGATTLMYSLSSSIRRPASVATSQEQLHHQQQQQQQPQQIQYQHQHQLQQHLHHAQLQNHYQQQLYKTPLGPPTAMSDQTGTSGAPLPGTSLWTTAMPCASARIATALTSPRTGLKASGSGKHVESPIDATLDTSSSTLSKDHSPRASSQCELVGGDCSASSTVTGQVNCCAGCLLACLDGEASSNSKTVARVGSSAMRGCCGLVQTSAEATLRRLASTQPANCSHHVPARLQALPSTLGHLAAHLKAGPNHDSLEEKLASLTSSSSGSSHGLPTSRAGSSDASSSDSCSSIYNSPPANGLHTPKSSRAHSPARVR